MPDVHARLSASGAKKWINCPGSIQMEEQFPDKASEFAKEGTTAHSLGEAKIKLAVNQIKRSEYSSLVSDLDTDEDMQGYTDEYRDFVIERLNVAKERTNDAVLVVEQRLDFSKWVPNGFGTGDAVIIADGTIEIIDLKYGVGVSVSAENNPQLRLYALGALDLFDYLYDINSVTMTIYQPRIDNISSETLSVDELYKWGQYVYIKAKKAADDNELDCHAGTHCDEGFCKARPACRAYAEQRQKLAAYDFKPPAKLSADEIAEILDQAASLEKWSKLVSDYALEQAVNYGARYPGFKLVEGRSVRKYTESDSVIGDVLIKNGYTEETVYTKKLKGITDMEKTLGKQSFNKLLSDFIVKPKGKPTLVHIEDKRPELNSAAEAVSDFDEILKNND